MSKSRSSSKLSGEAARSLSMQYALGKVHKPKPQYSGPILEITHLTPSGETRHTIARWQGPATPGALRDWIAEYCRLLQGSPLTELGFAPTPTTATITQSGTVKASWGPNVVIMERAR